MSAKTVPQLPDPAKPSLVPLLNRHQQFVIEDGIMPCREVHILAAASGVGKTTLMVQILDDLIDGARVFDAETHRVSPVYLCNDRSKDDIRRTFERVGPRNQYPFYSLLTDSEFADCKSVESSIRMAKTIHRDCDFIIYDPISFNVENINSSREVSALLRSLTRLAQSLSLTILIIHHAAKTKSDSFYTSPRQKIAGSGAWGGYSNLNLILEEDDDSDPTNPIRGLHVCPRNGGNRYYRYSVDTDGCFVPEAQTDEDPAKVRAEADEAFNALPYAEYRPAALYQISGRKSKGGLDRAIKRWIAIGCMEKAGRGKYLKIKNAPL